MGSWEYTAATTSFLVGDSESSMGAQTGHGRCRCDTRICTVVGSTSTSEAYSARGTSTSKAGIGGCGWGRRWGTGSDDAPTSAGCTAGTSWAQSCSEEGSYSSIGRTSGTGRGPSIGTTIGTSTGTSIGTDTGR